MHIDPIKVLIYATDADLFSYQYVTMKLNTMRIIRVK